MYGLKSQGQTVNSEGDMHSIHSYDVAYIPKSRNVGATRVSLNLEPAPPEIGNRVFIIEIIPFIGLFNIVQSHEPQSSKSAKSALPG